MLDNSKLERIVAKMKEQDMPQMIISDPVSIFYLLGKWIIPGERMLALYVNVNGDNHLVLNKLFSNISRIFSFSTIRFIL